MPVFAVGFIPIGDSVLTFRLISGVITDLVMPFIAQDRLPIF